jgi:hypothetical protein
MPETPVVNCVLLWARPGMGAELSAYEDKVLRLVGDHGGRVLQRGTVLPGAQHDGEPPAEVQFLEMPSEASLDACIERPPAPCHGSRTGRRCRPHGPVPHPAGFQNLATGPDLDSYAARSYSLMRPSRTGRRWIRSLERSATG